MSGELFAAERRDPSLVVLEGFHAFKHAVRFGADILHAVTDDPGGIAELAARLAPDIVQHLAGVAAVGQAVPGHLLAVARRPAHDLARLLAAGGSPLVFLERPSHLGNLGAAIRVTAAAGAAGLLSSGPHDPWHPHVVRGSAGLHFALPVARVAEMPTSGRPLVAMHTDGEPLAHGMLEPGSLLAFGSERGGLSPGLLDRADRHVAIPMRPGVSSLNLATAVAVTLYLGWRRGPAVSRR
ncbi:MAG TPA: TrmH family RNA methyltransferase [Geminicoccaceae bacterium]|nr:TrmH family RNA methyltransferase [Geminicoccus sp.]HMU51027.1 TrmH family RNA methyltransferase [Geminicoccaceae bacterium]